MSYKQLFMAYMDSQGIRYEDKSEFVLCITYTGDNLKSIPVYVFFDEDGDPMVEFKCWDVVNFKGKEDKGIRVCNELNSKYRWVKFCIDQDSDVQVSVDAYIDAGTCGEECRRLVNRVVNITDEAYPEIARALWL